MSALRDKQADFAVCAAKLILYVAAQGYQVTLGDAYRDPRVGYGHPKSCHRFRLALDLNLYVEGVWVSDSAHPAWKLLGDWWERLDPRARWGGKGSLHPTGLQHDGNHISFLHDGVE